MAEISVKDIGKDTEEAHNRIKDHVRRTPLEKSAYLSHETGANVYLKLESEQLSGSFKIRGAFNKSLKLSSEKSREKLYTASSGNHGIGMTIAMKETGQSGIIYVRNNVSKVKEEVLLFNGAELKKFGSDIVEAEMEAKRVAEVEGGIYVSPYNDPDVIAGQGTIAIEIFQQLEKVDAIFAAAGGGALLSGVGSYAKYMSPDTQIIGCSPINSNALEQSVKAGKIINIIVKETLADSSCGNVDPNTITLPICQKVVDRWVSVTEEEIVDAMYFMLEKHHRVMEGSAGLALAAFLKIKEDFLGKNVVIIICGCTISVGKIKMILNSK